jgi:hypothetical protein
VQPLGLKNFAATSQVQALQFLAATNNEYVRLRNESDNECQVTFTGAGQAMLGPWIQDDFPVGKSFTGQVNVLAVATVTTPLVQAGYIVGQAWSPGELKNPGPVMMTRLVGLTGAIVTANSTLVNLNNPVNTPNIGQIQPAGDAGFTWTLDNMGNMTLGDATNPGGLTVNGVLTIHSVNTIAGDNLVINGASGAFDIFLNYATGRTLFIQENGVSQFDFTASGMRKVSAGDFFITPVAGAATWFGDISSASIVKLNASGIGIASGGNLSFPVGQIREFNHGTATTASSIVVSHGLSSTPTGVWAIVQSGSGSATVGCGSYTTTQFTLLNGANPTSFTFFWIAYRV